MNPSTQTSPVIKYFKNFIKQQFKVRKLQLFIAILFVSTLTFSNFFSSDKVNNNQKNGMVHSLKVKNSYQCILNRVIDGDTVIVHCPPSNKEKSNIRVWGIDAPEMKQEPWGSSAKNALIKLLPQSKHAIIKVEIIDIDRYNRYVGKLFYNNSDLGLELVKKGEAVVYTQYNKDKIYQKAENSARKSRLGIWKQKGAQQDPAAWRKLNPR